MANKRTALKELRKVKKRRENNIAWQTKLRKQEKKVRDLIASQDAAAVLPELNKLITLLDRSAAKNMIHRNTSARKKSRITKQINRIPVKKA